MTTLDQEPDRPQGYLEGRLDEQSIALQDLKAGQLELGRRIDAGLQEMRAEQQELSRRLENHIQDVRAGQRQMTNTILIISGGVIATLIGGVIALVIRLG